MRFRKLQETMIVRRTNMQMILGYVLGIVMLALLIVGFDIYGSRVDIDTWLSLGFVIGGYIPMMFVIFLIDMSAMILFMKLRKYIPRIVFQFTAKVLQALWLGYTLYQLDTWVVGVEINLSVEMGIAYLFVLYLDGLSAFLISQFRKTASK